MHQKVAGSIPDQGTYLGHGVDPPVRAHTGGNQSVFPSHINISLSLSLSNPLMGIKKIKCSLLIILAPCRVRRLGGTPGGSVLRCGGRFPGPFSIMDLFCERYLRVYSAGRREHLVERVAHAKAWRWEGIGRREHFLVYALGARS